MENKQLKLVLCWYMHQPEYRDLQTVEFVLPWTYLHDIEDYIDMAVHLNAVSEAKAVINFVSILLKQIEDDELYCNAYFFLSTLFICLVNHPQIELIPFSACLETEMAVKPSEKLILDSWIYAGFSTWIGVSDKNHSRDKLGDVKLAICEGSDWFWWLGDYNPEEVVSHFEKQYWLNLSNLYRLLGEKPPAYLLSFTQGSGTPAIGGVMRQSVES